jgi:hypothetical protein
MPTESLNGLDLDTASLVLQDLRNDVLCWVDTAAMLQRLVEMCHKRGIDAAAADALTSIVLQYAASNSMRVYKRVSEDTYRSSR